MSSIYPELDPERPGGFNSGKTALADRWLECEQHKDKKGVHVICSYRQCEKFGPLYSNITFTALPGADDGL